MIEVECEWRSSHEIEPPAGVDEEEFHELLRNGDEKAWEFALEQTNSQICELVNWEVLR